MPRLLVLISLAICCLPAAPAQGDAEPKAPAKAACSLTVGGAAHTFAACPTPSDSSPFRLFLTLAPDGSGGTLVHGGLRAKAQEDTWVGWGLGAEMMSGANTVVVRSQPTASSGAAVQGYVLPGYDAASINAAAGTFALTDTAAAFEDGHLSAVFKAVLPAGIQAAPFSYIWASGRASSSGGLSFHYDYGVGELNFSPSARSYSDELLSQQDAIAAAVASAGAGGGGSSEGAGGSEGAGELEAGGATAGARGGQEEEAQRQQQQQEQQQPDQGSLEAAVLGGGYRSGEEAAGEELRAQQQRGGWSAQFGPSRVHGWAVAAGSVAALLLFCYLMVRIRGGLGGGSGGSGQRPKHVVDPWELSKYKDPAHVV